MTSSTCRAVLLDVDGTLLDSNDAHARAWVDVLARHGHAVPYDAVRPLIGKGGDKLLREAAGIDDESVLGKGLSKARRDLFLREHLPKLAPTRGARALLERLRSVGVKLVVATSATGEELSSLLRQAGVDDLIESAASSDDAEASKPDPDIVAAALRKAGVPADEALMLGDTPYDVASAQAASVRTVVLRCGGWWTDDAFDGAAAIYDDPADLLDRWAGSPFDRGEPEAPASSSEAVALPTVS